MPRGLYVLNDPRNPVCEGSDGEAIKLYRNTFCPECKQACATRRRDGLLHKHRRLPRPGDTLPMTRELLLETLPSLALADRVDALLVYVDDPEITEAFRSGDGDGS